MKTIEDYVVCGLLEQENVNKTKQRLSYLFKEQPELMKMLAEGFPVAIKMNKGFENEMLEYLKTDTNKNIIEIVDCSIKSNEGTIKIRYKYKTKRFVKNENVTDFYSSYDTASEAHNVEKEFVREESIRMNLNDKHAKMWFQIEWL